MILGTITLGLGIVGIVLPILPTTPFLLITLFCYTKGSYKFERWYKKTSIYQKHLYPFVMTKAMTNINKFKILFFVTAIITIPFIIIDNITVRIILSIVVLSHYIYFVFRIKSLSKNELLELLIKIEEKQNTQNEENAIDNNIMII